jgi:zinc transporter 1
VKSKEDQNMDNQLLRSLADDGMCLENGSSMHLSAIMSPAFPASSVDLNSSTPSTLQSTDKSKTGEKKKQRSLNMHGVFLHVLGDALGSVAVIISALFIWFSPWSWRFYVDPAISILIASIILATTVPLVRGTCYILLQGTPSSIPMDNLRRDLQMVPFVIYICNCCHYGQLVSDPYYNFV